MSSFKRFKGRWGEVFAWEGGRTREYSQGASGALETWLIGKAEQAENFALRYYELEPGGYSRQEQHSHDHGVLFMRGRGEVTLGQDTHPVNQGDVIYIEPDELHQIRNSGQETLGWLCIIPARRRKGGQVVWSEEGLENLRTT
ncbi:MAG: cupin domain-containing protein [Chloroflexota bacterium]|nr:MAG: cupin domain-containing protein [Chloroflexota bacterium]